MEDDESVAEHASPIRIDRVRPLGTGRREVELGFFHACYPEGVQDKVYRLRILHRSRHQLPAVQLDGDGQMLRLGAITRAWLARQLHIPMLVTLGFGPDAN